MSIRQIEELFVRAQHDPELTRALKAAGNLTDLVRVGDQHGYVFSREEAEAYFSSLPSEELLDAELEAVAGGTANTKGPAKKGEPYLKYQLKDLLISS